MRESEIEQLERVIMLRAKVLRELADRLITMLGTDPNGRTLSRTEAIDFAKVGADVVVDRWVTMRVREMGVPGTSEVGI